MIGMHSLVTMMLELSFAVTVLVALVLMLGRSLRSGHAVIENGLYRMAFVSLLLMPVVYQVWQVTGHGWVVTGATSSATPPEVQAIRDQPQGSAEAIVESPPVAGLSASALLPARGSSIEQPIKPRVSSVAVPGDQPLASTLRINAETPQSWFTFSWTRIYACLFFVSVLGTAYLLGRQLIGAILIAKLVRRSVALSDQQIARIVDSSSLSLRDLSRIRTADFVHGPAVMGTFAPRVILPVGLIESEHPLALRAVLAHEFAHLERQDPLVHAAARLATALWWWHPLVRTMHTRLRQTTEVACDRFVLKKMSATDYAETLLGLSQRYACRGGMHLTLSMVSRPPDPLSQRISVVLSTSSDAECSLTRLQRLGIGTSLLGMLALFSMPLFRAEAMADDGERVPLEVASESDNRAAEAAAWTVSGVVLDELGKPAKAQVFLRVGWNGPATETTTNDQGQFRFPDLQHRRYVIWALNDRGRTGSRHFVDDAILDERGFQSAPITLRLKRGAPMRVHLVNIDGAAIAGAEIKTGWMPWTMVDNDGWGMTAPLTHETWTVKARAPGYAEVAFKTTRVSGSVIADRTVTLTPGTTIEGTVRDEHGNPIAEAVVWISLGSSHFPQATSEDDGSFKIHNVPRDAAVNVAARHDGHVHALIKVNTLIGQPTNRVQLVLAKRGIDGQLRGIVLSQDGNPIVGAIVKLTSRAEQKKSITVESNASGEFTASDLYLDDRGYDALTTAPGHALNSTLMLMPRAETDADSKTLYKIKMTEGRRYEATIVDSNGIPMKGVSLRANYYGLPLAKSDEQGRIVLEDLAVDSYISLHGGGFVGGDNGRPNFENLPRRFVSRPPGVIRGQVVDESGNPIERYRLQVWFTPDGKPGDARGAISADLSWGVNYESKDGRFEVPGLTTGSAFQVIVLADGYRTQIVRRVEVIPTTRDESVVFQMEPLAPDDTTTIAGRLLSSDNQPAVGVSLRLLVGRPQQTPMVNWDDLFDNKPDRDCKIAQNLSAKTDSGGRFRFDNVQTGGSITMIHRQGDVPETMHDGLEKLTAEQQANLELHCPAGGKIEVTVAPNLFNERILVDLSGKSGHRMRASKRLPNGKWTLDPLPPGQYNLEVWPASTDRPSKRYKVVVNEGRTTAVHYPP